MWFELSYRCPFCMIAHIASGLVFVFVRCCCGLGREATVCWQSKDESSEFSDGGEDAAEVPAVVPVVARAAHPSFKTVFIALVVTGMAVGCQHAIWWGIASQKARENLSDSACQKDLTRQKATVQYWQKQFRPLRRSMATCGGGLAVGA